METTEAARATLDLSGLRPDQLAKLNTYAYKAGMHFNDWQNARGYSELREMLPELPDPVRQHVTLALTCDKALCQIRRATVAAGCQRWPI